MIPWILLDKVPLPQEGKELRLYQRDKEYSIKVNAHELMNSRVHGSEDALARLACAKVKGQVEPKVLIGGLGMGFTLRAALSNLNAKAEVTVAELVPAVVKWNRNVLSPLAKSPLKDKRVTVYEGDVADKINTARRLYHAIILDVDNGTHGLTQNGNDGLYALSGLRAAYGAMQPDGVLAVWSAGPDVAFERRLQKAKFEVHVRRVSSRGGRSRGGLSVVFLATKGKT